MPERTLIVNADDFGRCPLINAGVIRAHEEGIVTGASLMVRWPAAADAAAYARRRGRLAVGLHIDLGEWVYRDGEWQAVYELVDSRDADAVEAEVRAQLEAFRERVGRDPTHLDSHQHVHDREPVTTVATRVAAELGVPLRGRDSRVAHCGAFYGRTREGPLHEAITAERLIELIAGLPPGVTELSCHPGKGACDPAYREERAIELEALCDPRVRAAIEREGVVARSFADLG